MNNDDSKRLDFLDALRGIAAIWVVLYHMVAMAGTGVIAPAWAQRWVSTGGMGVTLFFIVSAFSLCLTMPHHLGKPKPLVSFYSHRFFRIAPLFYFWVVLTLVRDRVIFGVNHDFYTIVSHLLFTFNLVKGGQEGFVWASWTIGVEMIFYLVFPLLFCYFQGVLRGLVLFLALLLLNHLSQFVLGYFGLDDSNFFYHSIFRHLPMFSFGMLIFYVFNYLKEKVDEKKWTGLLLIFASIFIFDALLSGKIAIFVFRDEYYWQSFIFGFLFLGVGLFPAKFFVNRVTKFCGKISYSLYLAHPTLIFVLTRVYQKIMALDLLLTFKYILCVLVTFGTLVPLSCITYMFIEKYGISLGRALDKKNQK